MQRYAKADGAEIEDKPPRNVYMCLFGVASEIPNVEKGTFWETRGREITSQFGNFDGKAMFAFYRRLATPNSDRKSFNADEKAQFFNDLGHIYVSPGLKIKDVQQHCTWTQLVQQSEGLIKKWHHQRIVLCGESVVQMTSFAGMGFNTALQSAVFLVNGLQAILRSSSTPSSSDLASLFTEYQRTCYKETKEVSTQSAAYIRLRSWSSWPMGLVNTYVVPLFLGEEKMIEQIGKNIVSKGRVLNCVTTELKHGQIPWEHATRATG